MTRIPLAILVFTLLVKASVSDACAEPLAFQVSFDSRLSEKPVDGRVYVIDSRDRDVEPRPGVPDTQVQSWGKDVTEMSSGQKITLDSGADVYRHPCETIDLLPAGDYTVQAFLSLSTTFHCSEGRVVQFHMPVGEGWNPLLCPRNFYSTAVQLRLSSQAGNINNLVPDHVIPLRTPVPPEKYGSTGKPTEIQARQGSEDLERVVHAVLGHTDLHRCLRLVARRLR